MNYFSNRLRHVNSLCKKGADSPVERSVQDMTRRPVPNGRVLTRINV